MSTATHATLENFLFTHSYLFFQHISRYYALPASLIEQYGDLWDFSALSRNDQINWDLETITLFAARIDWNSLSINMGPTWTADILERFEDRLNWYWLAENPAFPFTDSILEKFGTPERWRQLSCNPALPLTDAFLYKYGENLDWQSVKSCHEDRLGELSPRYLKKLAVFPDHFRHKRSSLPDQVGAFLLYAKKSGHLPKPLRDALEFQLSHMSDDFLATYAEYLDWSELSRTAYLEWSIDFFERFYRHLTYDIIWNRFFYQIVLAPELDDALIERICLCLQPDNQVPFYFVKTAGSSDIDLEWSEQDGKPTDRPSYQAFHAWFEQGASGPLPPIRFMLHEWNENPVHFTDLLVWSYPTCIVSARFKQLLEQFELPLHRFLAVDIHIADEFFGSETRTYYILYVPEQSYRYYDYANTVLVLEGGEKDDDRGYASLPPYHSTSYFTRQVAPSYPQPIQTPEEFVAARDALQQSDPWLRLRPQEYVWEAGFELISADGATMFPQIWVSGNLKKAIETAGLTGIKFDRVWEARPRMLGLETPEHCARVARIQEQLRDEIAKNPEPEQLTIRNFRAAQAWAEKILQNSGLVQKLFADNPAQYLTDDPFMQKVRQKEAELDLLFPNWFIRSLQTGQLPAGLEDFSVYPLESLYKMGGRDDFPLSVKAVEFASYGGDSVLFLALKKDSFYQLDDAIHLIEYDQGPPPWLVTRVDSEGNPIGKVRRNYMT